MKPTLNIRTANQGWGVGVGRSQRILGGVAFLRTLGVGVGFFIRLRKSNWIIFYIALQS